MNRFVKKHYHFISYFLLGIIFVTWILLQSYIYPDSYSVESEGKEIELSSSPENISDSSINNESTGENLSTEQAPVSNDIRTNQADREYNDPAVSEESVYNDDSAVGDESTDTVMPVEEETYNDTDFSEPEDVTEEETINHDLVLEDGSFGPGDGKMPFDLCLANVRESLNVRSGAGENFEIIAKFLPVDYAHILEKGDEWSLITSGEVTGYAHNDYLITDDKALKKLTDADKLYVSIIHKLVNIRAEKNTDSDILRQAKMDERFKCIPSESDSNWFAIKYDDGNIAYVATTLASVTADMDTIDSLTPVG